MSKQPSAAALAALQPGEWIEVMFKCSGFDYAQVVRNDPESRQVFVRERGTDEVRDISYMVGINLIPSSLVQLALQAEETSSQSGVDVGYKETDQQQQGGDRYRPDL